MALVGRSFSIGSSAGWQRKAAAANLRVKVASVGLPDEMLRLLQLLRVPFGGHADGHDERTSPRALWLLVHEAEGIKGGFRLDRFAFAAPPHRGSSVVKANAVCEAVLAAAGARARRRGRPMRQESKFEPRRRAHGAVPAYWEGLDWHRVEDTEHVSPLPTPQALQRAQRQAQRVPAHAEAQGDDAYHHRVAQRELAPAHAADAEPGLGNTPKHSVQLGVPEQRGDCHEDDGPKHAKDAGQEYHDPRHPHGRDEEAN
mmetsp:Transcript_58503/g.163141  ORF Transcript_58503/g.163141 Transcript_58503/m.163141 type:complete len:257 (+) Transcript_58503:284-1054(+)